jgi:hypothetical protein
MGRLRLLLLVDGCRIKSGMTRFLEMKVVPDV